MDGSGGLACEMVFMETANMSKNTTGRMHWNFDIAF